MSADLYFVETDGGEYERTLLQDLLRYYNSLERPVFNESDAVELQLGLTLQQIIDVVRLCQQGGALSLVQINTDTVLSLVEIIVLLSQLSYAMKNLLGRPKPPTRGFATQRPNGKESIIGAIMP